MLTRLSFAIGVSVALVAPRGVEASPITYDFAGTLNQPINGSSQFSGTFTIDSNPNVPMATPGGAGSAEGEAGAGVSLTVNIGGQTRDYVNTPQNPENAFFSAVAANSIEIPAPPPVVNFGMLGESDGSDRMAFSLTFTRPGTTFELAEFANLASPAYTSSVAVSFDSGGQTQDVQGSITSIELVSAPEPSTLAVFGVMVVAAMARRHLRRS